MMKYLLISIVTGIITWSCQNRQPDTIDPIRYSELRADTFEVTVGEFSSFIQSSKYITTADSLKWSVFFDIKLKEWVIVENANWKKHDGQHIANDLLPVVHVSYYDACAYCKWKGGRLPSANEWDALAGDTVILGNVWQGLFPHVDLGEDGYVIQSAPVGQFEPNVYGYYDMFGNVWEWTTTIDSFKDERILKGGSFLCDYNICQGYIPSRYQTTKDDSGLNHLGFRCVYDQRIDL